MFSFCIRFITSIIAMLFQSIIKHVYLNTTYLYEVESGVLSCQTK